MITFSNNEIKFLEKMEGCRVATSHDDIPQVKPVSYIFDNNKFIIATDYETRMYKNLLKNRNVALVVDIYKDGGHQAVCVQGRADIIENGPQFLKFYDVFYKTFDWVRKQPWKENEAPFIVVEPKTKSSWGFN